MQVKFLTDFGQLLFGWIKQIEPEEMARVFDHFANVIQVRHRHASSFLLVPVEGFDHIIP
jgi:hypothetical protein